MLALLSREARCAVGIGRSYCALTQVQVGGGGVGGVKEAIAAWAGGGREAGRKKRRRGDGGKSDVRGRGPLTGNARRRKEADLGKRVVKKRRESSRLGLLCCYSRPHAAPTFYGPSSSSGLYCVRRSSLHEAADDGDVFPILWSDVAPHSCGAAWVSRARF